MAQNKINLSPEDQQMFEQYFKQKPSPYNVENAFDLTPDKIGQMAAGLFGSSEQQPIPQQQMNTPFYELPFEKPVAPISEAPVLPQVKPQASLPNPMAQQLPQEARPQAPNPMQDLLNQYKSLYSKDQLQSDADQMNKALDHKKELAILDMFMKGGSQLASGIAQTKPGEVIQTAGLADIDIEKAKQKSGLTDRQRQALEAQMKILDVQEMNDPNSPTSKVYRQTLAELSPSIAKMPDLANASAQAIGKIFPMVQAKIQNDARIKSQEMMLGFRQSGLEQRQSEEKRRVTALQINTARGLLKDDPRFKKAIEQGMEFESVNGLLDEVQKGNETALSALGTKLARAMGEVGVLTDTDVVRYIAGQSWGRRLEKWFKGGMQGKMPAESLKEIRKNLTLLRGKLSGDVDKVYGNASGRMKQAFPELDDQSIRGLLGRPMITPEEKQPMPTLDQFGSEDIE